MTEKLEMLSEEDQQISDRRKAGLEFLQNIANMMGEFVKNWPEPKRLDTALKLIAKTIRILLDPPKHRYWGAGEADIRTFRRTLEVVQKRLRRALAKEQNDG